MIGGMEKSHYFEMFYHWVIKGQSLPAPPYDCWSQKLGRLEQNYCGYSSYFELAWRGILDVLFPEILFGFLSMRLLFSQASQRFFSSKTNQGN